MDPKVKEIIDFFPGTEVEQIEEKMFSLIILTI